MAFASSIHTPIAVVRCLSSSSSSSSSHPRPNYLILPRHPPSRSVLTLARRRNPASSSSSSSSSSKKNKKTVPRNDDNREDDDVDVDAFEALFNQLEEDLKNDGISFNDGDDELSEEDLARLEQELAEALGDDDIGLSDSDADATESDNVDKEDEDDDEEEERPVTLKRWQLRRLASALKTGRRKTSIKSLAAELCLDRAVVLELLRDPPPNLLMMSAALPDEPAPKIEPAPIISVSVPETESMETVHEETSVDAAAPRTKEQLPIHVMQHTWSAQKRLKKAHVDTLERVYRRTKRPTCVKINAEHND